MGRKQKLGVGSVVRLSENFFDELQKYGVNDCFIAVFDDEKRRALYTELCPELDTGGVRIAFICNDHPINRMPMVTVSQPLFDVAAARRQGSF